VRLAIRTCVEACRPHRPSLRVRPP
jgi:hypothetical protein